MSFGNDDRKDFYVVNNTYGAEWGVEGYGRITCERIIGAYYPIIEEIRAYGVDAASAKTMLNLHLRYRHIGNRNPGDIKVIHFED